MEVKSIENNTYISLKENDGSILNGFTFLYGKSGFGKSLYMESLMEEYYRAGYTVICLSDVKDEFELAFAMFEPQKPYHVRRLKFDGKPIKTYPVKLYHPFTFNIDKGFLPEINFYGFSLKELRRSEWSMITENEWESETIRILLNASATINDGDGLYNFLHFIENSVFGKKDQKELKRDPKLFNLKTTIGTAKSLQDVASYFLPFKKHLFLVSNNSPLKLNWKEILEDNKHYHVFGTRWIEDKKLKEFCILALFNAIIQNRRYTNKPVLIVIPEIRFLVPYRAKGYKVFLAQGIKSNLSIMRNIGKYGNSGLFDSQVFSDVEDTVRNSATESFFGELGGAKDIEAITKAMRFKTEISQHIKKPDPPRSLIRQQDPTDQWIMWLPSHCHKEEEYNFFEMYKEQFRDKMKRYDDLIEFMKKEYQNEENKVKEKIKKEKEQQKQLEEQKRKEREEKKNLEEKKSEEKEKKSDEKDLKDKNTIMRLCYEMFNDESIEKSKRTYRKIGQKLQLNHITVKKYIERYGKSLNNQINETEVSEEDKEEDSSEETLE